MTMNTQHNYGWVRDLPDFRDMVYEPAKITALPQSIDLSKQCPAVYDQGQLGSCTANAIGGAFEFELLKQKLPDFIPSRLFIYYNERVIEGSINTDSGAQIRDGIKTVNNQGVCHETLWPYTISKFKTKPTKVCYTDAKKHLVTSYLSIPQDLNQMKACLAAGYPFVFGFSVYDSFEGADVAKTGVVNLPLKSEKLLGGHAVMCVGYDDVSQRFMVRNSWGTSWGKSGYFTMPYAYLTNGKLASDFWTIRIVE